MTERNKIEIAFFAKVLALAVWGLVTIATLAGVLNYCPEPFVKWCAGIVAAMNAVIIWRYIKRLAKEKDAAIEALQDKGGEL